MLPINDYATALEALSSLTADFIQSASSAHIAPNTEAKAEYDKKSIYVSMMFDIAKSLNGIRFVYNPQQQPAQPTHNNYKPRIYNPDNG